MTTKGDLSALRDERQQSIIERNTIKRQIDRTSQSIVEWRNVADEMSRLHSQYNDRLRAIDQRIDWIERQIAQIEHARATSMWQRIKTMLLQR